MKSDGKWIVTFDNEKWDDWYEEFDTKEEAITDITSQDINKLYEYWNDNYGGDEIPEVIECFVGQMDVFKPTVNTSSVLDDIMENAGWHGGDYADGYLDNVDNEMENELDKQLNEVLNKWIEKFNLQPSFYQVINIEKV